MRVWVRACAQVSCAPHRGGGPAGKLGACRRGAVGDLSSDGCDEGCDAGSAMRRVVIVLVRNARCDTRNHPGGGAPWNRGKHKKLVVPEATTGMEIAIAALSGF